MNTYSVVTFHQKVVYRSNFLLIPLKCRITSEWCFRISFLLDYIRKYTSVEILKVLNNWHIIANVLNWKTTSVLKCKCVECKECASILSDIAKIFLLLNGAKTNVAGCVQTTALYEKSIDEYEKAVEMCGVKNCNCNC